ncbi:MAG: epoxyqueuosine reductase QueH [Dehalococcoidales bacterium]|jgi:predicted adenine nucleotide alpha hydrolase (AANH) superfamily ATPase
MSKVLIHVCCAHCAAYTAEYWRQQGCDVSGFWYNPNIHPYMEYQQRLESMKTLAQSINLPLIIAEGYDMAEFFRRVAGHEAERCKDCFSLRLTRTAAVAKEKGYDAFTTTLLISPHQKHELIQAIGNQIAAAQGISFAYADLRKRYSDSRHITKPMDLYRQQYCGCLYSELERYTESKA